MKLVVTVVGKDRVGIIAMVSRILAENNVNILSINQNILDGFFNMILIAEISGSKIKLTELQQRLMWISKPSMKIFLMLCIISDRAEYINLPVLGGRITCDNNR